MGAIGKYVYLIRKKLAASDYEEERTLSKVAKILGDVSTAVISVIMGLGMAQGFKLGSGGAVMPVQVYVPVILLVFNILDLFSKLFYKAAKVEIPPVMSLMPFKKKSVVSIGFAYAMSNVSNLTMPLAVLALMVVGWPYGIAPALWLFAVATVAGIVNTAMTANIKESFARREYLKTVVALLLPPAFYVAQFFAIKYWLIPMTFGGNTLYIVMGIYLTVGLLLLLVAWAIFVSTNKYPAGNAGVAKKMDAAVVKSTASASVMTTFLLSEALRSPEVRKALLLVLLCGAGIPILSSLEVGGHIPYYHEILTSIAIFIPVTFGIFTYSSSSLYMDRMVSLPGNFLPRLLSVRYRIVALLMFVFCSVVLLTSSNPDYWLILGITLFAAGPVAILSHCSAAFFATRWDIMDGKARFIWNPFDLLSTAAYCAATFGAFVLAHYGYSKIAGMVYMAIGAAFVLSHDFWLNRIYATFRKRRYVLLDKYRNLD